MRLRFKRKISKLQDNRSTLIVIPRVIACAWEQYDSVDLVFDGNHLIITPTEESKHPIGDEEV